VEPEAGQPLFDAARIAYDPKQGARSDHARNVIPPILAGDDEYVRHERIRASGSRSSGGATSISARILVPEGFDTHRTPAIPS
jgi:hypothetical protein